MVVPFDFDGFVNTPPPMLILYRFGSWFIPSLMIVVVGRVQDITPGESYVNVIWIFMGIKGFAIFLGFIYIIGEVFS